MRDHRSPWLAAAFMAVFLGHISLVWAGAWTVPRERWYAEYYYRYLGSKHIYDSEGNSGRRPTTALSEDIRNEWKLEYGLTDWCNLLASLPYISSHYRDDHIDLLRTGIGDIYLRTKLRFIEKPVVGSAQFSWKIPGAYDPNKNPIGDGQFDFESRVLVSRAWTFSPYQVPVPRNAIKKKAQDSGRRTHLVPSTALGARQGKDMLGSQPPASNLEPNAEILKTREAAMRDALIDATLRQAQARLPAPSSSPTDEKWLGHAGQNPEPFHETVLGWFDETLTPEAEAAQILPPMLAMADRQSVTDGPPLTLATAPHDDADGEPRMETRYAKLVFVNAEGAFTARREEPANEFTMLFEVGATPFKRLMLVSSLESTISVKSTHEDTEDFAKWGVRAIVNVWGDGFASIFRTGGPTVNMELGYNDIFAGRNTANAYEVFAKIGLFF